MKTQIAFSILSLLFLTNCNSATPSEGTLASTDAAAHTGRSGTGNSDEACDNMNSAACGMFHRVNRYRVSMGVAPMKAIRICTYFSQDHSEDMSKRDYFSHNSPTETFKQRVERSDLPGATYGENIAWGNTDIEKTFMQWRNSPGHNKNMLNPKFKSTGIGYYEKHWTQCFSGKLP